jgi:hypothetical protein
MARSAIVADTANLKKMIFKLTILPVGGSTSSMG